MSILALFVVSDYWVNFLNWIFFSIVSISPPPNQSSAQQKYDKERFRVEPGRIENYTIGKGNLAQQESYKVELIINWTKYYAGQKC